MKHKHAINPGGSPFGIHSYMAYLVCARKAFLTERLRKEATVNPLGSSEALRVGTLFHFFQDAYEKAKDKRFSAESVEFSHVSSASLDIDEAERQEAQRLFTAWRAEYWDAPLGKTLGTEVDIKDSEALGAILGVRPITARLDRVFSVDSKREHELIKRAYGVSLPIGLYVQDYKTAGRRDNNETEKRAMDFQFTLYQLAAQLQYKLDYVPSLVVSTIYKTATVGFEHRVIPPPRAVQIQGLRDMLLIASRLRAQTPPGYNPTACADFFGPPCYFYGTGECQRTATK